MKWLDSHLQARRAPAIIVGIACILSLPSLRLGLLLDDYWHRAKLATSSSWSPGSPGVFSLFEFASGSPAERASLMHDGFAPWWFSPGLRVAFFRPLTCLTHALDYALWPRSPWLMHVHSIVWYAALLWVVSIAYRRWLPGRAAMIALLFYAIDPTHGIPVGWLANRNALIAALFALGSLLLWDSRRKWLSALALAFALAAGESAIAILGFFVAHWLFMDRRVWRDVLPIAFVAAAWAAIYRIGHYGVIGSGIYADPLRSPWLYAKSVLAHVPVLVGVEVGGPSPDPFPFVPVPAKVALIVLSLGFIAWTAKLLWSRATPLVKFFALGSLLAVLPGAATFPAGRLVVLPGFGLVALCVLACAESRWYSRWAWLNHVWLAPFFFIMNQHAMKIVDDQIREWGKAIPTDGSATNKRLVLVNAPDTGFPYYLIVNPIEDGLSPPRTMLVVAGARRNATLTRIDARSFTMHQDEGFYRDGTEILFRDPSIPSHVGDILDQGDTQIRVTHVLADGTPDEATFTLTEPIDDHYVFRAWKDRALVPFELPAPGQSVSFAGRLF